MITIRMRVAVQADTRAIQALYREVDRIHHEALPTVFRFLTDDARPDSLITDQIHRTRSDYIETPRRVPGRLPRGNAHRRRLPPIVSRETMPYAD